MEKGVLTWYNNKRTAMHTLALNLNLGMGGLYLIFAIFNLDKWFVIGRPEYNDFFQKFDNGQIASVVASTLVSMTAVIVLIMNSTYTFNKREKVGVWLFDIALIVQVLAVARYTFVVMKVCGAISGTAILYLLLAVFSLFLLVINTLHYRKYKDEFQGNSLKKFGIILEVVLLGVFVAYSVSSVEKDRNIVNEAKQKYEESEYSDMKFRLGLIGDELPSQDKWSTVGINYVNLFNDRGRTYTPEEIDQAIQHMKNDTGSWYVIKEINDDFEAIEEKYDFTQYSIDEYPQSQDGNEIYEQLVYRRIKSLGMKRYNEASEPTQEDIQDACLYVYELLSSGKSMDKIGEQGDIITVTYGGEIKPGEQVSYDVSSDNELAYPIVAGWSRVAYVGGIDEIESYTMDAVDGKPIENGNIYKVDITIYPEITYYFNRDIEVKLEGIDCNKVEYFVYENYIAINVWIAMGEELGAEDTKQIETISLSGMDGLTNQQSIADMSNTNKVVLQNNGVICKSLVWQYYMHNVDWKDYYSYCNPFVDDSDFKYFTTDIPAYRTEIELYADTGYMFSDEIALEYNGESLALARDTYEELAMPVVNTVGYVRMKSSGHLTAYINFYRIKIEAENGTVESNVDFVAAGTKVTLNPIPDEGYKFVGYETIVDMEPATGKEGPEVVDGTFVMPKYPVIIKAVFEQE